MSYNTRIFNDIAWSTILIFGLFCVVFMHIAGLVRIFDIFLPTRPCVEGGHSVRRTGGAGDLQAASAATESSYLVCWSPAVSSCSSSAFCHLESGLYSFIALARASVFLPRSF